MSRNRFVPASLSELSLLIDKSLSDWLRQMSDEDRRSFTETVFSLFEATGADTFSEISQQKWKSAEAILTAARNLPREKQKEILKFVQLLGASGGQTVSEFIAAALHKPAAQEKPV